MRTGIAQSFDTAAVFASAFANAVAEEIAHSGFDPDEWYTAGRGSGEGSGYWEANGAQLAQNFIDWYESRDDVKVWTAPDGLPAVELPIEVNFGSVPVRMYIDLVLEIGLVNPALVVVDFKSGSTKPKSPRQLAIYASGIEAKYGIRPRYAAYFLCRGTERAGEVTYLQTPYEMSAAPYSMNYLAREFEMFDLAVEGGVFPAHPGDSCRKCSVSYACTEAFGEKASLLDPNYPRGS